MKKLIAESNIVLVSGHRVGNCSSILLDTKANIHVFCNKELLTNLRPIEENGVSSLFIEGIVRGEEICVTHDRNWGPFKDVRAVLFQCGDKRDVMLQSGENLLH